MKRVIPYLISLGLFAGIAYYNIDVAKVSGDSMSPLISSGQTIWGIKTDRFNKNNIVIADIDVNGKVVTMVKRVYGVKGDHIRIEGNSVFVNGELIKILTSNQKDAEFVLGDNEYFLLGDNPNTVWVRCEGRSIKSRMEFIK